MVAAISHHDAHFIQWRLPLAQGLQYQAIWLDLHGQETTSAALRRAGPRMSSLAG